MEVIVFGDACCPKGLTEPPELHAVLGCVPWSYVGDDIPDDPEEYDFVVEFGEEVD